MKGPRIIEVREKGRDGKVRKFEIEYSRYLTAHMSSCINIAQNGH